MSISTLLCQNFRYVFIAREHNASARLSKTTLRAPMTICRRTWSAISCSSQMSWNQKICPPVRKMAINTSY